DGEAARRAVAKDQQEGYGLGATSTPSFLVNGRPLAGAQPQRAFTDAIEAARKAATEKAAGSTPSGPKPSGSKSSGPAGGK
ncbi:disulfide bond formation protein DsbA, partial [Streptomyces sp. NPDC005180]